MLQLREGAAADVFASADWSNMQRVVDQGAASAPARVFAHNRLAVAVAEGNPKGVAELADLAREDLTVALCAPAVPAGRYAREALRAAGVHVRSVSDEPSVRAVVAKIELGEIDAGIVYATDVEGARGTVAHARISESIDLVAEYPIAVLDRGRNRAAGAAFVSFVLSKEGTEILRSFGFATP